MITPKYFSKMFDNITIFKFKSFILREIKLQKNLRRKRRRNLDKKKDILVVKN